MRPANIHYHMAYTFYVHIEINRNSFTSVTTNFNMASSTNNFGSPWVMKVGCYAAELQGPNYYQDNAAYSGTVTLASTRYVGDDVSTFDIFDGVGTGDF